MSRPAVSWSRILASCAVLTAAAEAALYAGDILRSGSAGSTAPASGNATAASASVPVTPGRTNAADSLARTTQALQAVQAMQAAARSAAASANNLGADPNHAGQTLPNVPDGLATGGLQIAAGATATANNTLWQGANLPAQTTSNGKTTVAVVQTTQQALLTWQTFNVGKNTTLVFDQSAGADNQSEWVAFNKISDPTGVPSQILGSIQAGGQVYVINQNGIIFGGTSQVNVHTLVASSLPINDNLVNRGLLNNPDTQFLFSSLTIAAGANGTPVFTPAAALTPTGQSGDVTVQAGAQLSSPTTPEHVGGRIALFGPNVTNAGTISTPDGQTILAAGQQIGLAAHDSSDPTLRGLDVYVGQGGGTATNAAGALIDAPRAAVTMVGKNVNQNGDVASTTSVAFNGRIDLLADYNAAGSGGFANLPAFFPQATGTVTLGASSMTQILPEFDSAERVVGTQLALLSQINLQGQAIHLGTGASIVAPGANLVVDAGAWNLRALGTANATDKFIYTIGQIYLDANATIDVSGSQDVAASVTENIVSVELRGSELADSPLQRDSVLRGQTVEVDIRDTGTYNGQTWVGTPLANASGYAALVQRSVGELTVAGGSVKMTAGNSVVAQSGSSINVSGGWIDYAGGDIATTKLLSGGQIIDISKATPDRVYDGIYTGTTSTTDSKWGTTLSSTNPQLLATYEPGYVQGGAGGSVSISAPAMALDGKMYGSTFAGPLQRTSQPTPSSLTLAFVGQDQSLPDFLFPNYSPTPPAITFQATSNLTAVGPFASGNLTLPAPRQQAVSLSPALVGGDGFANVSITDSDGKVIIPAGVSLNAPAGGSIGVTAASIDIEGNVTAPGGSLSFTAYDRSPYADRGLITAPSSSDVHVDPTRGDFTLGSSSSLDVSGLIVDDRLAADSGLPVVTKGGSVSIAAYSTTLAKGSTINASAGVEVSAAGKLAWGNAGSISLSGGQDPKIGTLLGGKVALNATLEAYGYSKGGALTLQVPLVQVGGTTTSASTLVLSPDFFNQGGFSTFTIKGGGAAGTSAGQYVPGVLIAPGTVLAPTVESWQANIFATDGVELSPTLLPLGARPAANLNFSAVGVRDPFNSSQPVVVPGELVFSAGARVQTDPGGSISFTGDAVAVLGTAIAPGGTIAVTGAKDSTQVFADQAEATPTVDLGPASVLDTSGTTVLVPDPRGYRTGSVLAGGTISVAGNIFAEAGSRLDVSGTHAILDLAPAYSANTGLGANTSTAGSLVIPTEIESNAGSITLTGSQLMVSDATLVGRSGGTSAQGGTLTVNSSRFFTPGQLVDSNPLDVTMVVTQGGPTIAAQNRLTGTAVLGHAVVDTKGNAIPGDTYLNASSLATGGFDAIALKGTVQFSGPVTLAANRSLTIGTSGVIYADGAVSLKAPYVDLGVAFDLPGQGADQLNVPTFGTGSLTVTGSLIDVGTLSLMNIGKLSLIADNGDIRGDGTLTVAGDITMRAGQIYPPTETTFNIAAYDHATGNTTVSGTVTLQASGTRSLPLSAGANLNIYGATISQGSVLRAPAGTINLGWDGTGDAPSTLFKSTLLSPTKQLTLTGTSITSVSQIDPITGKAVTIPYGLNLNGAGWIDPAGNDITLTGAPAKAIHISAQTVTDQPGSTLDIRGGGDLFAYRFVSGTGGTHDILASNGSFAVVPGYQADYAPSGAYNSGSAVVATLGGDAGYVNSGLAAGDRVYLAGSPGLPAGIYTLLPARYALLPGAFLVTPKTGAPTGGAVTVADGSSQVSGYRFNDLAGQPANPVYATFEVAPQTVTLARAEYDSFSANTFLQQTTATSGGPRLPVDSGQLLLTATQAMTLQGGIVAQAPTGGRGGLVDIDSASDIVITGTNTSAPAGTLALSAAELSSFGAESLLVGGVRTTDTTGTTVNVLTRNLTVDNSGSALKGTDVILAATNSLKLANGADVEGATGNLTAETLHFGNATTDGSGNGAVVRVGSDATAQIVRAGVDSATSTVSISVGAGAKLTGASVIVDSTHATTLDSTTSLGGQAVALGSGQISIQLSNTAVPAGGLILSGAVFQSLQTAQSLSLLSYSTIDIYGAGQIGAVNSSGQPTLGTLSLHAGDLRSFGLGSGTVTFAAKDIVLDNATAAPNSSASAGTLSGSLVFNAGTVHLGNNTLAIDQFANVAINASSGIVAQGSGALQTQGALSFTTPVVTGIAAASETISAGGALTIASSGGNATSTLTPGLGVNLVLSGTSVAANGQLLLPGGSLTLHATSGDLNIGNSGTARLDVGGTAQTFFDVTQYSNGGELSLIADRGTVNLAAGSTLSVAAATGDGAAGMLSVSAPGGTFNSGGTLLGTGGGSFSLDVGHFTGTSLGAFNAALNTGGFTQSRSLRLRNGDAVVDGLVTARNFNLSTDAGSITVAGTGVIDASGTTGGTIGLEASGGVTLQSGARLSVAGQNFDDAGKGGSVSLETRGTSGGQVAIQSGSTIDLSVAANTASSAAAGDFTGTLHLRAPQNTANSDLAIAPIAGTIRGASNIVVEGYQVFDLTTGGGAITAAVETSVKTNGTAFTANTAAITTRLLGTQNAGLGSVLNLEPGAEIVNTTGDLTLGSTWDLSTFRFGPNNNEPGVLTLRAAGNLVFAYSVDSTTHAVSIGSLSDGFGGTSNFGLWDQKLLAAGSQSWSYRLVAGADLSAADYHRVQSLGALGANAGSVLVGQGTPALPTATGQTVTRASIIPNYFQVIRTGTGDINIAAGRDVELLNPLATIYTAGTQAAALANFDTPILGNAISQNPLPVAQYSLAGGNVAIFAQQDIAHQVLGDSGSLIADSSRELPTSWLYRRGSVDGSGNFVTLGNTGEVASTSWWVDFSNFFEGVGALGGGNVALVAGRNVSNVDAVIPTNARMPKGRPDASSLVELGGGDLTVRAGADIDGGVYYVERGQGVLDAGGSIHSNATRAALTLGALKALQIAHAVPDSSTWLPTTLFVGKGSFTVNADKDVLLGPVANAFLLPQSVNNRLYEKTYFSTYASTDTVNVSSLTGDVTLRDSSDPTSGFGGGSLGSWYQNVLATSAGATVVPFAASQPWIAAVETDIQPFTVVTALMPSTLDATAFTGSVNISGSLLLVPSATGSLELLAAKSINGLEVKGLATDSSLAYNPTSNPHQWAAGIIDVSDADPSRLPGVATPLSNRDSNTPITLMDSIDALFAESGSTLGTQGVLQTKQALHAPGVLHTSDATPARLYAGSGDIADLTLYSPKATRVVAGRDITDIGLYIQNDRTSDLSLVAAGRDLIAYDPNSPARLNAQTTGNVLGVSGQQSNSSSGDIQISGPGTLEVVAGRNFDLGAGRNTGEAADLDVGITSIGNGRNPGLPFEGADVIAAAGIGPSVGLGESAIDFNTFVSQFLNPATAGAQAARYLPDLGDLMGLSGASNTQIWNAFNQLPADRRDSIALDVFYLVLRDAGRDHNDPKSSGFGGYANGFAAVAALVPKSTATGNISLSSRELRTKNGGNIDVFAPRGGVTLGFDLGTSGAPPGILTEHGGDISIFANNDVSVGALRIFTLRGGNEIIWSSAGSIAAGVSSKTVQSAPPTRVQVDPQSADVKTDLAGLATGGGIGVLASVAGVPPGNVDLIAPAGTIDAGDAGIRVSGNLNVAALQVVNASNIQTGGTSVGTPATVAPNVASLATTASSAAASTSTAANDVARSSERSAPQTDDIPSLITVEVLGYGGGDGSTAEPDGGK